MGEGGESVRCIVHVELIKQYLLVAFRASSLHIFGGRFHDSTTQKNYTQIHIGFKKD